MKSYKQYKENASITNEQRIQIINEAIVNIESSLIGLNGTYYNNDVNQLMKEISQFRKNWESFNQEIRNN